MHPVYRTQYRKDVTERAKAVYSVHEKLSASASSKPHAAKLLQAIYSEDISKRIGNEPVVQALKELMKYEMAMLVSDDDDDKSSLRTDSGSRSNHDNVCITAFVFTSSPLSPLTSTVLTS